eukprot:TRINITY_DN11803_c0_g1_i1.p1 TRINITY_DN11803_c0_g1~~TRINITY_DN11803_c0_g1_i1.p1  ORF type:complete len:320 (+),score=65.08 TRINITY_DN11803_c0_g1_i1:79-1038(+)
MVSHKYTRERLYNLQYAPLSKVAPEDLYEEVSTLNSSNKATGGGKAFVASKTNFADVIKVKSYEKGKEKNEERRERKPKAHKEEDSETQKFQNWENEKFSEGLRWGGDAAPPQRKTKVDQHPPEPKAAQPRSQVDELFAGASSSQTAPPPQAQPRGGSKFMKHFKQSDEPEYPQHHSSTALHSGGTEQEIIKQFMGSASNVQTLDAASFEKELIANASVGQTNSPPAPTQGFVDAASLEKALLQTSMSTQPTSMPQSTNQSGTFDAANLEAQLLAGVSGGSSHSPQQQSGGLPPLLAMQQQQRNRMGMGYTGQPGRPAY